MSDIMHCSVLFANNLKLELDEQIIMCFCLFNQCVQ